MERIETAIEPGRPDHTDPAPRLLPAEVVAERDEIDEVVGVEVADEHGAERGGVEGGSAGQDN